MLLAVEYKLILSLLNYAIRYDPLNRNEKFGSLRLHI